MEKVISLLEKDHTMLLVVVGALLVLLFFLILLFLLAFVQGRSISLWPPKIGEKTNEVAKKDHRETNPAADDANLDGYPYRFLLNCAHCGNEIRVTNPRLKQEPKRVYIKPDGGGTTSSVDQYIKIGCPVCKKSQSVQFNY